MTLSLSRRFSLGLLAGVAVTLIARPLAYHLPAGSVFGFWAVVLLTVGLPGVALAWAGGFYRKDLALLVGQGLTLGVVLHGLFFLAGRILGLDLGLAFPVIALTAAAALWRFRRPPPDNAGHAAPAPGVLATVLAGCLLQPLASVHVLDRPLPADLAYHTGNAAEVRHRWPLQDPRVAGLPLNYPVLSYALPAAASRITGLPMADALHGAATLFWIGLLALQVHNAARLLVRDRLGATLGTLAVLLHQDVGSFLGLGPGAFSSALGTGIFGSPTTVCGIILFSALSIAIIEAVSASSRARAAWPLLITFAVGASLTKATVVPVAAGACLLVALHARWKGRTDVARAALACAVILAAAAAPFTIRLGTGDTSYRGILRWDPGAVVQQSLFAQRVASGMGLRATALVTPFWLAGYLGFAGVGALVFLLRRRPVEDAHVFALGAVAAGAVPALLLDGHGLSQLFFLYNGQVLLAALAGGAAACAWRTRSVWILFVLALAAAPALVEGVRGMTARRQQDRAAATHAPSANAADYAAGLAWLRAHASREGVVFADNPSLLLSALGECQMYYETGLYTARGWERRWEGWTEPFPERAAFQEALLRRTSDETAAEARRLFPPPAELLVVADSVQSSVQGGILRVSIGPVPPRALLPPRWFRPVFANRVMHVYRLERP